jgi:hypothetical protein
MPMIGRKTKGGRVMMSSPLRPPPFPPPVRGPDACGLSTGEGVGDSPGDGVPATVGVGGGRSVKLAQGLGWTLAHSLWTFGLSPAKGLTVLTKEPLASVTTDAATWLEASQ